MKIVTTLMSALVISGSALGAPSGHQSCYNYSGGPFLVFDSIESGERVSVGFSGDGADPYSYQYLKINERIKTGCDVCFQLDSQYSDADGKKVDVKIITEESSRGSAFNAKVFSKRAGSSRWSSWHHDLRCIDWTK
jgi:hypothetical protein